MLIASMSDCTVCRLESVFVIGGFRVGYCSSSIYLYIGDVVLRDGSYLGKHKNCLFLLIVGWKLT